MELYYILLILFSVNVFNVYSSYSIKDCDDNEFKCYNGGSCIQFAINATTTIRICSCKAGFTGRQCEQLTMPCSPDPCAPNGYCNSGTTDLPANLNTYISASQNYFCRCKPGFTGYNCKENINDCINATCHNGGLCIDGINSYTCDCPWPYSGRYCETRLTCSLNFCKNNSTCIEEYDETKNDITSKCLCSSGYMGVDCSIKLDACHTKPCLFGGKCVTKSINDYECKCPLGRNGKNCQLMDICYTEKPCKNNSTCIQLDLFNSIDSFDSNNIDSYAIVASSSSSSSSSSNMQSSGLDSTTIKQKFVCQCKPQYTGINCDVYISDDCINGQCQNNVEHVDVKQELKLITSLLQTTATTTTTASTSTVELPLSNNLLNGSFVLILNLTPEEFKKRKYEIIQEFSKQLGIFMLIKKDQNSQEMIYPYEYTPTRIDNNNDNNSKIKKLLWTKVYFIIIFACIDQNGQNEILTSASKPLNANGNGNGNICLNDLNSLNDIFNFVTKLRQATNLPSYVSNITYEANEIKSGDRPGDNKHQQQSYQNQNPIIIVTVVVSVLVTVIILLGMIVRHQQAKNRLIKAPIWFPPYSTNDKLDVNTNLNTQQQQQQHKGGAITPHTNASSWSFQASIKNFFKSNNNHPDSPQSDENFCVSSSSSQTSEKPIKMRKIDNNLITTINTTNTTRDSSTPLFQNNMSGSCSSNCTTSSEYLSTSLSPPALIAANGNGISTLAYTNGCIDLYYPSPPESLPDYYTNIKGPLGLTPLMCLIMNQKSPSSPMNNNSNILDLIDTLVSKGADLNAINTTNGETALHLSIRNGLYDICEKLINYGTDINISDKQGRNALHTAVGSNQFLIIKLLIQKFGDKLDIDAKTSDALGETSLICAARNNFNDIIKLLISNNATINATDNYGQSALHWCAKVNNCQGAVLLLENGANINLQDENEKTPLSVAIDELNTNEIIQILIKYQAFVSSDDEKLLEFKHKILNNQQKKFKETNILTSANILSTQQQPQPVQMNATTVNRHPSMKLDKESNDISNGNRKRKLNATDIAPTSTANTVKATKSSRKLNETTTTTTSSSNQVPLVHQIKLKSENNLTTSTPSSTLIKKDANSATQTQIHASKSVQENMNYLVQQQQQQQQQVLSSSQYNNLNLNYDYLTSLNTLANKNNLHSSVFNTYTTTTDNGSHYQYLPLNQPQAAYQQQLASTTPAATVPIQTTNFNAAQYYQQNTKTSCDQQYLMMNNNQQYQHSTIPQQQQPTTQDFYYLDAYNYHQTASTHYNNYYNNNSNNINNNNNTSHLIAANTANTAYF